MRWHFDRRKRVTTNLALILQITILLFSRYNDLLAESLHFFAVFDPPRSRLKLSREKFPWDLGMKVSVENWTTRRYELCLLVHKALIGQAPDYTSNLLTLVTNIPSRSSLRASSNGDLFQPRTERRIGDRAFSVAAPRAWNRLPTELKLMRSSTATFRHHLKSVLCRIAYWLCNTPSGRPRLEDT